MKRYRRSSQLGLILLAALVTIGTYFRSAPSASYYEPSTRHAQRHAATLSDEGSNPVYEYAANFKDRDPIGMAIFSNPLPIISRCATEDFSTLMTLILVNSRPKDFQIRSAIRQTWMNSSRDTAVAFLVGTEKGQTSETNGALRSEISEFQDIIWTNISEHFYSLPLKTFTMLHWTQKYCPLIPCLLKTDSDVIVFPENLAQVCDPPKNSERSRIFGHCWSNAGINRDLNNMKRGIPMEVYPRKVFPRYCSGSGYLLTRKARIGILNEVPNQPWGKNWKRNLPEDVLFTGALARKARVSRVMTRGFNYVRILAFTACDTKTRITTHEFKTATQIITIWKRFAAEKLLSCRKSYNSEYRPREFHGVTVGYDT